MIKNIENAILSITRLHMLLLIMHHFCLRFPLDIETRSLWLKACGISDREYSTSLLICSKHFEKDSFQLYSKRVLKSNAIPIKFTRITKKLP